MKKSILLTSTVLIAAMLCSCGGNKTTATADTAAQNTTTAAPAATAAQDSTSASAAKNSPVIISDGSKVGVLQKFPDQDGLDIKGLIITTGSGHHEYDGLEALYAKGYKTEGLNSEYYLNEWIEIYADTDDKGFQVYAAKNDPDKDYSTVAVSEIDNHEGNLDLPMLDAAEGVEKDNYGYIGSFYINPDSNDAGLYNVFFVKSGKVCYMVQLSLVPEPVG